MNDCLGPMDGSRTHQMGCLTDLWKGLEHKLESPLTYGRVRRASPRHRQRTYGRVHKDHGSDLWSGLITFSSDLWSGLIWAQAYSREVPIFVGIILV